MELILKLVAYKAVCCSVHIMVCDVKEREWCTGKIGRESKRERARERDVDGQSGSEEGLIFLGCLHLNAASTVPE